MTLVLLHYSEHIEDTPHVDFELQTFYIHPRQTGRVAIAMHSLIGTAGFWAILSSCGAGGIE